MRSHIREFALIVLALASGVARAENGPLEQTVRAYNSRATEQDVARIVSAHLRSKLIARYDRNFDGVLDADEAEAAAGQIALAPGGKDKLRTSSVQPAAVNTPLQARAQTTGVPEFIGVCANSVKAPAQSIAITPDGNNVITPLVRRNFTDVFLFTCPTSVAEAKGAEFAFAHNGVLRNTSWSVNGMAAVAYQHFSPYGGILGFSLTPFAQIEKTTNSSPALRSRNTELLTGGFSAEIGLDAGVWSHYSRFTGAFSSDQIGGERYRSVSYEWIPVSCRRSGAVLDLGCPTAFAGLFLYRFHPSLFVQYDATSENSILGLSDRNEALRIGPRFVLMAKPIPRILEHMGLTGPIASFVESLEFHVAYHIAREVYSHRPYHFFEGAISYNLDAAGYSAISLSYQKGRSETNGDPIDLLKASLTLKY